MFPEYLSNFPFKSKSIPSNKRYWIFWIENENILQIFHLQANISGKSFWYLNYIKHLSLPLYPNIKRKIRIGNSQNLMSTMIKVGNHKKRKKETSSYLSLYMYLKFFQKSDNIQQAEKIFLFFFNQARVLFSTWTKFSHLINLYF